MSITSPSILYLDALKEIHFDPISLLPAVTSMLTSSDVRRAFLIGWETDRLALSREQLEQEALAITREANALGTDVLIVSHSFRLKIMQGYLMFGNKFFHETNLIHQILQADKHTFAFDERFTFAMK